MNMQKSMFTLSQSMTYLGVCFDSGCEPASLSRAHRDHLVSSAPLQTGTVCSTEEISEASGPYGAGLMDLGLYAHCGHKQLRQCSETVLQPGDVQSVVGTRDLGLGRMGSVLSPTGFSATAGTATWVDSHQQ